MAGVRFLLIPCTSQHMDVVSLCHVVHRSEGCRMYLIRHVYILLAGSHLFACFLPPLPLQKLRAFHIKLYHRPTFDLSKRAPLAGCWFCARVPKPLPSGWRSTKLQAVEAAHRSACLRVVAVYLTTVVRVMTSGQSHNCLTSFPL